MWNYRNAGVLLPEDLDIVKQAFDSVCIVLGEKPDSDSGAEIAIIALLKFEQGHVEVSALVDAVLQRLKTMTQPLSAA